MPRLLLVLAIALLAALQAWAAPQAPVGAEQSVSVPPSQPSAPAPATTGSSPTPLVGSLPYSHTVLVLGGLGTGSVLLVLSLTCGCVSNNKKPAQSAETTKASAVEQPQSTIVHLDGFKDADLAKLPPEELSIEAMSRRSRVISTRRASQETLSMMPPTPTLSVRAEQLPIPEEITMNSFVVSFPTIAWRFRKNSTGEWMATLMDLTTKPGASSPETVIVSTIEGAASASESPIFSLNDSALDNICSLNQSFLRYGAHPPISQLPLDLHHNPALIDFALSLERILSLLPELMTTPSDDPKHAGCYQHLREQLKDLGATTEALIQSVAKDTLVIGMRVKIGYAPRAFNEIELKKGDRVVIFCNLGSEAVFGFNHTTKQLGFFPSQHVERRPRSRRMSLAASPPFSHLPPPNELNMQYESMTARAGAPPPFRSPAIHPALQNSGKPPYRYLLQEPPSVLSSPILSSLNALPRDRSILYPIAEQASPISSPVSIHRAKTSHGRSETQRAPASPVSLARSRSDPFGRGRVNGLDMIPQRSYSPSGPPQSPLPELPSSFEDNPVLSQSAAAPLPLIQTRMRQPLPRDGPSSEPNSVTPSIVSPRQDGYASRRQMKLAPPPPDINLKPPASAGSTPVLKGDTPVSAMSGPSLPFSVSTPAAAHAAPAPGHHASPPKAPLPELPDEPTIMDILDSPLVSPQIEALTAEYMALSDHESEETGNTPTRDADAEVR